jgi:outer membrane protein, heavy metal efflux system
VDAARRSYQATGNTLMFRIKDDWLMSAASWRLLRIYSTTLIPQAALTLESSMSAYETGQVDFLTMLMNLMAIREAEESYHEAMMDYHLALVRLEEMTGLVLVDEN